MMFSPGKIKTLLLGTFLFGVALGTAGTGIVSAAFNGSAVFGDVPSGSFYNGAVGELYSLGIIKGKSPTVFDPNAPVTRGEVAVLLQRLRNEIKGITPAPESSSVASSTAAVSSSSKSSSSVAVAGAGTLKLSKDAIAFPKSAQKAIFTVIRTGGTTGQITVHYNTVDGSAVSPTNYSHSEGTITFANGEDTQTVNIPLKNTSADGYNTTFTIQLSAPTGGAALGTPATTVVTILDVLGTNPVSSSSSSSTSGGSSTSSSSSSTSNVTYELSASTYSVFESAGSINVTVYRKGSTTNASTVNYATSNRTGTSGTDYTAANGTLSFASGESSKTFSVSVTNHSGSIDGNKTFNVTLGSPSAGTTLGTQTSGIVTIIDEDAAQTFGTGTLLFTSDNFTGTRGSMATVSVQRQQTFTSTMTVHYTTNDSTALSNADYTPVSGDFTFLPGEVEKTFTVPILTGAAVGHQLGLSLSNVTGGTLSTPFLSGITIQ